MAMVFCFYLPEIKNNIGAFQTTVLKQLSKFSWWKVIIIFILLFFVGVLRELSQGDFLNLLLAQEVWVKYHSKIMMEQYLHSVQEIWWIAQIIGAALIYYLFVKKIGIKNSLILAFVIWGLYFILVATIWVPGVLLGLQILNGFAVGVLFGILFSLVIMWNYRIRNRPITGCFSALNALMTFLVQFLIRVFANNHLGIFNNLDLNWQLPFVENEFFLAKIKNVILFLYLGCAFSCFVLVIFVYYTAKFISGEYYNPQQVATKLAELERRVIPPDFDQKIVLQEYLQIKKEVT
ncbi:hypothetical protein [Spiroplasma endosymbiont of Stenodema calcarata]|uniref:hypothetical protein n=1 Tax=Spiroplasma endosymbiont of Stenodema calcarata TaxID=3139328 RepID=UPI003CCAE5AB